jgi:Protein of unknown function (DUF992)
MVRKLSLFACAALALAAGATSAQARTEVGVLACRGVTTSYIVASRKDLQCVFHRADGQSFRYTGKVVLVGVDIGVNQTVSLDWRVLAPTYRVGPGDLRGNYGGVSAGMSLTVGLGLNALLGGSNNTIALQPFSVEGQTGWSVAAGVAGLELH